LAEQIPANYAYFRYGDQVDTGNVMFKKEIMSDTGMFDRQFEKQRQGDGEWGLRAFLCGKKNISNPYAKRIHLKVATGGLRQMGLWDAYKVEGFLTPLPIPSVLYLSRKYFGDKISGYNIGLNLLKSVVPYKYKNNKIVNICLALCSLFIFPVLLYRNKKSWRISSNMLNLGDKIDIL